MTPALAFAAFLLAAAPEQGASGQAIIDQIGAPDAPGEAARGVSGLQPRVADPVAAPVPPPSDSGPFEQLNTERPSAAALADAPAPPPFSRPQQLNDQRASAEAPVGPPVPRPRQATIDAVSGDDVCDPARGGDAEVCADRIETRADEFAPPPSPEAQLLAGGEAAGDDARAAARRLADGDVQNSDAVQAYVFTSGQTPAAAPSTPVSPETQKALDAAAQLLGVLPAGAVVTPR